MIPALAKAEYLRYGVMHRNTYLSSPDILNADFSVKENPALFFAGQITGVEGYVESAASGLLAGLNMWRRANGKNTLVPSDRTVLGALAHYVATPDRDYQPMNANFGILAEGFAEVRDKKLKKKFLAERALEEIRAFRAQLAEEKE